MKSIFFSLVVAGSLSAFLSCSEKGKLIAGAHEYTFPEPLSSISAGNDCLWLGSELGSIYKFQNGAYSGYYIEYGRICEIVPVPGNDSIVLVSIKNLGMKLVKLHKDKAGIIVNYKIKLPREGEKHYTATDIVLKKDTIVANTQSGLYYVPLRIPTQYTNTHTTTEFLQALPSLNVNPGLPHLTGKPGYSHSSPGAHKYPDRLIKPELTDSVKSSGTPHNIYPGSMLYELGHNVKMSAANHPDLNLSNFRNNPVYYFRDSVYEWTISNSEVLISDGNRKKRYTLSHPIHYQSGICTGAEIVKANDFIYLISQRSLLEIPEHPNLWPGSTITSTYYDGYKKRVLAITSQNYLFSIDSASGKISFLRHIKIPDKTSNSIKLIKITDSILYIATTNTLYAVDMNSQRRPRRIASHLRTSATLSFNKVIPLENNSFLIAYTDSVYRYYPEPDSTVSILPSYSFNNATRSSKDTQNKKWLLGSLHNGLWMLTDRESKLNKIRSYPATVLSVAPVNDSVQMLLSPDKIYKIRIARDSVTIMDSTRTHHDLNKLIVSGRFVYALSVKGGMYQFDVATLKLVKVYYKDVVFQKENSFSLGADMFLTSNLGCAFVKGNRLDTINWLQIKRPSLIDCIFGSENNWINLLFVPFIIIVLILMIKVIRNYKSITTRIKIPLTKKRKNEIQVLEMKSLSLENDLITHKRNFEQLLRDKEEWESMRSMVRAQRLSEINRLKAKLDELYPLAPQKDLMDAMYLHLTKNEVDTDEFLLSPQFWSLRDELNKLVDDILKMIENRLRKSIEEKKNQLAEFDHFSSALELMQLVTQLTDTNESGIEAYTTIESKLDLWLRQNSYLSTAMDSINPYSKFSTSMPVKIDRGLKKLTSFVRTTDFKLLSYQEWNERFDSFKQDFLELNSLCAEYNEEFRNSILNSVENEVQGKEIVDMFLNFILVHNTRFSNNHLATLFHLCHLKSQLHRLKVISDIEALYNSLNALPEIVRKKAENDLLDPSNENYQYIKEIQNRFNEKTEEFYKDLPEIESKDLKLIGLIKSGTLYRKLLLLQMFNSKESRLSNTYIITGHVTEDAKDTLRDRRSELKTDKIKPNIDKIINNGTLSILSIIIQLVNERMQ